MNELRHYIDEFFEEEKIQSSNTVLNEGWKGALLGWIAGTISTIGSGGLGMLIAPLTLWVGHKMEDWYQDMWDCKDAEPGKERAECVLKSLKKLVSRLEIEKSRHRRGTKEFTEISKSLLKFDREVDKLERKLEKLYAVEEENYED